jgi:hypothetical protein
MPQTTLAELLRSLPASWAAEGARDLTDGELLERFLVYRQETAFGILVQRHGPMVLGVCQRVLGDSHLAEDSFQATFMVLVRRAASIGRQLPLGGWLYAVAQRIAMKARAKTAARRNLERRSKDMPQTGVLLLTRKSERAIAAQCHEMRSRSQPLRSTYRPWSLPSRFGVNVQPWVRRSSVLASLLLRNAPQMLVRPYE